MPLKRISVCIFPNKKREFVPLARFEIIIPNHPIARELADSMCNDPIAEGNRDPNPTCERRVNAPADGKLNDVLVGGKGPTCRLRWRKSRSPWNLGIVPHGTRRDTPSGEQSVISRRQKIL